MLVKIDHILQYIHMNHIVQQYQEQAPDTIENITKHDALHQYYGPMTKSMLRRMVRNSIL